MSVEWELSILVGWTVNFGARQTGIQVSALVLTLLPIRTSRVNQSDFQFLCLFLSSIKQVNLSLKVLGSIKQHMCSTQHCRCSRNVNFLSFYFCFQQLPSDCLSDISAWMSPTYLKFNTFQTKLSTHLTLPHTLLPPPTSFSPRPPQFCKWYHQSTWHPVAHARSVGVILDSFPFLTLTLHIQSFSKSCPFHPWAISQICPLLSICLASRLFPVTSASQVSSIQLQPSAINFPHIGQNTVLETFISAWHPHS